MAQGMVARWVSRDERIRNGTGGGATRPAHSHKPVLSSGDCFMLSICVPVFNERSTLAPVLERLLGLELPLPFEIVAVDDGSTDGSADLLKKLSRRHPGWIVTGFHRGNLGKAAAVSTAISISRGGIVGIQDADLEYDPREFERLLLPILRGRADAVFGSRYLPRSVRRGAGLLHTLANRFLTETSNAVFGLRLTDMETCHKVFIKTFAGEMPLRSKRFAMEPELVGRLVRHGARIVELPVTYDARLRSDGKKIGWRDGIEALHCIALSW